MSLAKSVYTNTLWKKKQQDFTVTSANANLNEEYQELIKKITKELHVTPAMKNEIIEAIPCSHCMAPCFYGDITGLEICPTITRASRKFHCCSIECMKKDSKFKESNVYYYSLD
jgi:hypothetical protein